ncbi:MAG: type II secretion system minor pseudopilin GspI [Cellvibrionaceae bacterium]
MKRLKRTKSISFKNIKGFTLVEVMVALAVIAIALPALMSQILQMMDGSEHIRDKTIAGWVAQNQLEMLDIEFRISKTLLKGKATGEADMANRKWYWEIVSEQQPSELIPGIWKQTVSVGPNAEEYIISVIGFIREEQTQTPKGAQSNNQNQN